MRVHVTGASGFLGSRVVPALISRGHETTALARSDTAARRIAELGAIPIRGDLDALESVHDAFAESAAEALVNLASLGFGHAPTIVSAAERAGLKRAVFVSTTGIFTKLNPRSKAVRVAAEDKIRSSLLDWTIVRPTMIYGTSADRNIARLLHLVQQSPVVPVPGGGRRLQQPVHVDDLANAIVAAIERPETIHRSYDLAGPEPLTFRELIEQASSAVGRHPLILPMPLRATIAAVRLYERAAKQPRLKAEQLERLAEDKAFDISAARHDLGFNPRSFVEGARGEAAMLS